MLVEMTVDESRRKFLSFAGASTATAIAGCTGSNNDRQNEATTETTTDQDNQDTDVNNDQDDSDDFAVTVTLSQKPDTLDPLNTTDIPAHNVFLQAYDTVLTRSPEGSVEAAIAAEWEVVEPDRFRLTIRDDVTFHDGDKLTPEDVAYSINRTVDPNVGISSPKASNMIGVTGAEVSGENTVDVLSDGVNPLFIAVFAGYLGVAVMQKSWTEERENSEIAMDMNGTGPFQLEEYQPDVSTQLTRYNDYWGDEPEVTDVTMNYASEGSARVNQLLNGETDLTVNVSPQDIPRVQENEGTRPETAQSQRIIFGAMRYDVEPFSNQQFRQAMNYAIDLESIVENVLSGFGQATGQPTLPIFFGYNEDIDPYPYDPERAAELVEESGFAGAEIEFHTPIGRYLRDVEIAEAAASYIDELPNVNCNANQRDFSALAAEVTDGEIESTPPFFLIGWGNPTFDAGQSINPWLTTDGSLSHFSDEEIDEIMAQANTEGDRDAREELLQEANAMIHEKALWLFLNQQTSIYGINSELDWTARVDEFIDVAAIQKR